jgi:hypothetical protein
VAKELDDQPRQLRSPHTLDDVYLALRMLAFLGGNVNRAARVLKDGGHPISAKTIQRWSQRQYPDRYSEIVAEVHRDADQQAISRAMELVVSLAASNRALGRLFQSC